MHELEQVLVQREEAEEPCWNCRVLVCFRRALGSHLAREARHVFVGQVLDFKQVNGDSAAITASDPLGVLLRSTTVRHGPLEALEKRKTHHLPCALKRLQSNVLVQRIYLLRLTPVLRLGELLVGALNIELASA
jgi:hypothetical protein